MSSKSKPFHKVLILVIASRDEAYDEMTRLWKSFMNTELPHVRSFLVYADPTVSGTELRGDDDDVLVHGCVESLVPGIFRKTNAAIQYCEEHFAYEYILRTNLSSFIVLRRLLSFLETHPKIQCAGPFYVLPEGPKGEEEKRLVKEILKTNVDQFFFLHGACMLLSRSCVLYYLDALEKTSVAVVERLPDDVAMGALLHRVNKQYLERWVCTRPCTRDEIPSSPDVFHFRNRVDDSTYRHNSKTTRQVDIENLAMQVAWSQSLPHHFRQSSGLIFLC